MNQSKNLIMKSLALTMVLFIIVIPALPSQQYKKVEASEGVVDPQFYAAVLTMIGVTSVMIGSMSDNFSIPSTDFTALKDQFAQTLEADATKKAAWMNAQTDYLSGGVAKTMGAVELAKIGVNDLYNQFSDYLNNKPVLVDNSGTETTSLVIDNMTITKTVDSVNGYTGYMNYLTRANLNPWSFEYYGGQNVYVQKDVYSVISPDNGLHYSIAGRYGTSTVFGLTVEWYQYVNVIANLNINGTLTNNQLQYLLSQLTSIGINVKDKYPDILTTGVINGSISKANIINSTDTTRSIYPTIPWIDTTVPAGTIVTPAIVAPYVGAVPIDVPISTPIDPTDPIDPPVEEDNTLIGTVAAILAGILPISGILDNINVGIDGIATTITNTITDTMTVTNEILTEIASFPTVFNDYMTLPPDVLLPLKEGIPIKFPIIQQFKDAVQLLLDGGERPLIITYPYKGETKYITLEWYEPIRLQVKFAIGLIFQILLTLAVINMVSSILGMPNIGKPVGMGLSMDRDNNEGWRK